MITSGNTLLIVNPQNDFYDPHGGCYCPNAEMTLVSIGNQMVSGKYNSVILLCQQNELDPDVNYQRTYCIEDSWGSDLHPVISYYCREMLESDSLPDPTIHNYSWDLEFEIIQSPTQMGKFLDKEDISTLFVGGVRVEREIVEIAHWIPANIPLKILFPLTAHEDPRHLADNLKDLVMLCEQTDTRPTI